jgi:hypothetical protein
MKTTQLLRHLLYIFSLSLLAAPLAKARNAIPGEITPVIELQDYNTSPVDFLANNVQDRLAQVDKATKITQITINRTTSGLEIVLETQDSKVLIVDASKFTAQENALIAEISDAVLDLPDREFFQAENPTPDITQVWVEQATENSIRIFVSLLPETQRFPKRM